jgi:hypothetical protein
MPRVEQSTANDTKVYGTQPNTNQKLFQERLMERFKAHEYVKVINPDDEEFIWQYMPQENEEYEYTPDGMHRHTRRTEPEVWTLKPGETDVLVGANAYVMIDGLYKKLVSKKAVATVKVEPGRARSFNYSDGEMQEKLINKILIGKEVPSFSVSKPQEEDNEPVKRGPGRPARQEV